MKIGFIGLGQMGTPLSQNLHSSGFDVTVFNRTQAKMAPFREQGIPTAKSLDEVVAHKDVLITMLADDQAVEDVSKDIVPKADKGAVLIDMSTISPKTSEAVKQLCDEYAIGFLDAPVSGSVNAAEARQLVYLVGGDEEVYHKHQSIFDALGKAAMHFGPAGSGEKAKLVVNLLLGVTMQGLSEALLLADQTGLDRKQVLDMLQQSVVSSPLMQFKAPLFENDEYPSAFALQHMAKDLSLISHLAESSEAVLPLADTSARTFSEALDDGKGTLDMAGIIEQLKDMSQKS